jgi:threonine/homoserine/homoserine lactone efflux protein
MNFFIFAMGHLLAVLSPGQTFIGMTNFAIKYGFKQTSPFVFGTALANIIVCSIVVFGLSQIIFKSLIFSILFYMCGGGYLMYFSFKIFFDKAKQHKQDDFRINKKKVFLTGFFIDLLNPKNFLFTASLVAIVIKPESSLIFKCFVIVWLIALSVVYELLIIWFFSMYRLKILNILKAVNKIFGLILFVFGFKLIFEGIVIIKIALF